MLYRMYFDWEPGEEDESGEDTGNKKPEPCNRLRNVWVRRFELPAS